MQLVMPALAGTLAWLLLSAAASGGRSSSHIIGLHASVGIVWIQLLLCVEMCCTCMLLLQEYDAPVNAKY
jgi:hypothetical protein